MSSFQPLPAPLNFIKPIPSDIDVSQSIKPEKISVVAENIGVKPDEIFLYGNVKAKISLDVKERLKHQTDGNYLKIGGLCDSFGSRSWQS